MGILDKIFGKKKRSSLIKDIETSKNWIVTALNSSNYKADFSFDSLRKIDRFFDEQNVPGGILSQNAGQKIFAIGAYIGEVIISTIGGEWITDDNDPQGEMNISIKLTDGSTIFPVQRVIKRYKEGKESSIHDFIYILRQNIESE